MFQIKEQDKTLEEDLSDVETGKLPKKELKVMTIKKKLFGHIFESEKSDIM